MSLHLYTYGRIQEVEFIQPDIPYSEGNVHIILADGSWLSIKDVDIINFKNQVLWAYEKYLRERKGEANGK